MLSASVLQLIGLALVAVGIAWLVHPAAGVIAAGAACILVGVALELRKLRTPKGS